MSNRQATKHVNILDYVIARLLREGVDDKAGEDDRDSAGDCTSSSEVSTCVTDEGSDDDRDSAGDCTPSSEVSTGEMDEGSDDDGVRRTVGDITTESVTGETEDGAEEERDSTTESIARETEDSCFVTGDASDDLKIPETSNCAAVISTQSESASLSLSACTKSTTAYGDTAFVVWQFSLKTGESSSRSMRSSSAMTSTRLETVETEELIVRNELKRQKVKSKVSWNLQTTLVPRFVSLHAV